jgi:cytochrome c553
MRRSPLVVALSVLVASVALAAAGCGGGEETTASPETVTGTVPTETTETETTETDTTETDETETTETDETETETTDTETTETGATEGDPAAGKQVFVGSAACGSCHTLADAGTTGTVGPNLDEAQPSFDRAHETITNGRGAMPAFAGKLSEQQIRDVATYVAQAPGG